MRLCSSLFRNPDIRNINTIIWIETYHLFLNFYGLSPIQLDFVTRFTREIFAPSEPHVSGPTCLARQIHGVRRLAGANIQGGLFALAPAPTTAVPAAGLEKKRSWVRDQMNLMVIIITTIYYYYFYYVFLLLSFLTNKWCASFWPKLERNSSAKPLDFTGNGPTNFMQI